MAAAHTGKPETPRARVARLRKEVGLLGADPVSPAVADFSARTSRALGDISAAVQERTRVVSEQVEQRPFAAMLVALALGWLVSRVLGTKRSASTP
nr:hypothetical protein [uncultured Rhodopila sp.]